MRSQPQKQPAKKPKDQKKPKDDKDKDPDADKGAVEKDTAKPSSHDTDYQAIKEPDNVLTSRRSMLPSQRRTQVLEKGRKVPLQTPQTPPRIKMATKTHLKVARKTRKSLIIMASDSLELCHFSRFSMPILR